MDEYTYYVYILTNAYKRILYTGVTNNLTRRLKEHITGRIPGFSSKYNCHYLVYYEQFQYINDALKREKEIKNWRREKKEKLITIFNPEWEILNERFVRKNIEKK